MATLAQLVVKLTADTGKFQQDLQKSSGTVSKFASSVTSNVKGLGKAALGGVTALTGLATTAGLALGKLAMDAAQLETVEAAFAGVAASSGESAEAMLKSLEQGSSGMIAQRDLMLTYNKAASLVGTTFANQLPDAMQYLSKVSAATGQDMGFMLDSLVTGVGRLSPMILDNLAIQVSLSEATERASEMFGVEAGALTKAQQQAGMMSVTLEKLAKNTESMPDVSNSAAAGIARMRAKFQNLKDSLGRAFLPVLILVMNFVQQLAERVGPVLVMWVEKLSQVVTGLAPTFQDVVTWMGEARTAIESLIAQVWPAIEPIASWIQNNVELKDVLTALGIAIGSVVIPAIVGILTALAPLIATGVALVAGVALVRQAWENDWGGIRTFLEGAIARIAEVLAGIVAWVQENWPKIRDTVMTVLTQIWEFVQPILETLVAFIVSKIQAVIGWVQENWPLIQSTIQSVLEFVQGIVEAALGAVADFWAAHGEKITAVAAQIWTTIQTVVDSVLKIIAGIIKAVMQAISGDWKGAHETLKGVVQVAWAGIKSIVRTALSLIKMILSIAWNAIQEGARVAWEALPKIVKGALDIVRAVVKVAWDAIKTAAKNAWEAVGNLVQAGLEKVVGFITGIVSRMEAAGKAIVDAVKKGISDAWDGLVNWFNDRLNDLGNLLPFSEPKDPRSRLRGLSRAGEAIVSNILRGFDRAMPRLEMALASVAVPTGQVSAAMGGGPSQQTVFNLEANYPAREREDLAADVRLLRMLYGET